MRVILDTNVLVSAVLRGSVAEEVVDYVVRQEHCQWVASHEIITEYLQVIRRPKLQLSAAQIDTWSELIADTVAVVEAHLDVNFPRDQQDAMFLACALASNANFLITGDRDFEDVAGIGNTAIVTPRQFKETIIDLRPGS